MGRKNPAVTTFVASEALSFEDKFDLHDKDFMMAFTLVDGIADDLKADERYIKWQAAYYTYESGVLRDWRPIGIHKCTDDEFDKFYEPNSRTRGRF